MVEQLPSNPSSNVASQAVAEPNDDALRAWWRTLGGEFHGPRVETGTMPEALLLPFLRGVLGGSIPEAHPDDVAVDRFAAAMKAKLARKRGQGYHGWETAHCDYLAWLLIEHVVKGDPVDVANFAMMLFHNEGGGAAIQHVASRTLRVPKSPDETPPRHFVFSEFCKYCEQNRDLIAPTRDLRPQGCTCPHWQYPPGVFHADACSLRHPPTTDAPQPCGCATSTDGLGNPSKIWCGRHWVERYTAKAPEGAK